MRFAVLIATLIPGVAAADSQTAITQCFCGEVSQAGLRHSSGEVLAHLAVRTTRVRFAAQSDGAISLVARGGDQLGRAMFLCRAEDGGGHSGVAASRLSCGAVRLDEAQDCEEESRLVATFPDDGGPLHMTLGGVPLSASEGDECGTAGRLEAPAQAPLALTLPNCPMEACTP